MGRVTYLFAQLSKDRWTYGARRRKTIKCGFCFTGMNAGIVITQMTILGVLRPAESTVFTDCRQILRGGGNQNNETKHTHIHTPETQIKNKYKLVLATTNN